MPALRLLVVSLSLVFAAHETLAAAQTRPAALPFDIIIRHGTVLDGTGTPKRTADVGIRGDYIASVGDLSNAKAALEIEARGLFVAPGFINIHSHAMPDAVAAAQNMVQQGVTTEIVNADGQGELDISKQLAVFAQSGLAENLGAYVGFNSVWASVIGEADVRPTPEQVARMKQLLVQNLERGAFGVSGGLDYRPAYFAKTDEVAAVLSAAAPWRTNFPNHERLAPEQGYSSRAGISETIRIGQMAGIAPEITHIKAQGHEQGRAGEITAMMSASSQAGHFTPSDVYPYLAGQTGLGDFFVPLWAQEGGEAAMLARFKDPALRARIVAEAERAMDARFHGPSGVYLYESGRNLTDVMKQMHATAGEAVLRLVEERPSVGAILRFGAEPDLIQFLRNPDTAIACDCGADTSVRTHPRYFGAFPRVLGHYVRETSALSWEAAIRKMTALPASIVGLADRGLIAAGMLADLTVFDPAAIIDRATYEQPTLASAGVVHVLVNGEPVLMNAKSTGKKPGRVLARKANMPTRATTAEAEKRLSFHATALAPRRIRMDLELTQSAGQFARGRLQLRDDAAGLKIETTDFGFVQSAAGWIGLTGIMQTSSGEYRRVVVLLDRDDPLDANRRPTLSVYIPGEYELERAPMSGF